MRRSKKILIFVALAVFAFLVFFFFGRKAPKEGPRVLPTPNIPKAASGGFEITLDVLESEFHFPKTATVDTKKTPLLGETETKNIASGLGLTEGPIVAEDIADGTVHIFRSETASLTAYLDKGLFLYTLNTLPVSKGVALKEDDIKNLAAKFLADHGLTEEGAVTFSSFLFLTNRGGEGLSQTKKEDASIYQVNFTPANLGLPLVATNPQATLIYVQLTPSGEVFAAKAQRLSVVKGITEYRLKNYNEVRAGLGSAVLVSLDDGNIYLSDLPKGAVKRVEIKSVELAYYGDAAESLLPVFLMKGEAAVAGFDKPISAWLYLPALAENQP